jgi:iron complex outermembrane receptor protein
MKYSHSRKSHKAPPRLFLTLRTSSVLGAAIATVLYGTNTRAVYADSLADTLDEIIVTARYRAEKLQDVPQNIDVFASQDIRNLGIEKIEDFLALAPSSASSCAASPTAAIRTTVTVICRPPGT